jgi:pimeloyl-ACP methyl ester carboxylesterase
MLMRRLSKILFVIVAVLAIVFTVFWYWRPADVSFNDLRTTIPHIEYSKFADVDGVHFHYQEKGTGVTLVLIHGYTSSTYTWKDVFDALSEKYHVIAVDLKGFGFSSKPDGDYSRRAQANLVADLLDQLNLGPVWVVGNSMGGEIALNLALFHRDKVLGLVLIDSGGITLPGTTSLTPWYVEIPLLGRALVALALTSDRLVRVGLAKSYYDQTKISEEEIKYYYQPLRTRDGQSAATSARQQAGFYPVEDQLNKIRVSTLIIWGEDDQLIPVESARVINSHIPGSRLIILPNCGHVPQEELPQAVLEAVMDFIG